MNNKGIYGAIAVTFIIAVVALFTPVGQFAGKLGAAVTTNLPSIGLGLLQVGTGCDQSYTSCTAASLNTAQAVQVNGGEYVKGGVTEGGVDSVSTTTTSYQAIASELSASMIDFVQLLGSNVTLTLPLATNITTFIPNVGDTDTQTIFNDGTSTLTIAGNTNVTLLSASSTAVIQANKIGNLKYIRTSASAINVVMTVSN